MGLGRTLLIRGLSLVSVVVIVLFMLAIVLGATGVSERVLESIVSEELGVLQQALAQRIKDPNELRTVMDQERISLRQHYGLDQPWYFRIPRLVLRVLALDLGNAKTTQTFTGSTKIVALIAERLPNTILLITSATIISAILGLVVGTYSATRVGSRFDQGVSLYSAVSFAIPTWWIGIIFILAFAYYVRFFPPGGMFSAPPPIEPLARLADLLWHSLLPILTLVLAVSGVWIYVTRSIVLNTSQEDFVTVARAKGLPEQEVLSRYILRPSAPPILTNVILGLAGSIGGAILTETVFGWPGMGLLYYEAVVSVDEALIVALTFMFTVIYVAARFILEVIYVIVDPRVRY